jgi:hypothetical protein
MRAEDALAGFRMDALGADDEIETAFRAALEGHIHRIAIVDLRGDPVAEHHLRPALHRPVERQRQFAARQADEAAAGCPVENFGLETAPAAPVIADQAHLADLISGFEKLRHQPHLLGNVIALAPEIDDIAARARCRRFLDYRRRQAMFGQPPGHCRAGYTRAADQDIHRSCLAIRTPSRQSRNSVAICLRVLYK